MSEPTPLGGVGVPKCLGCVHYSTEDGQYPCTECKFLYLKKQIMEDN